MIYSNKLAAAYELAKPFKLDSFILFRDSEGWTNGIIADLTVLNLETMKAKAVLSQGKLSHYTIDRERCPEVSKIIPEGGVEVTDLEWNLNGNFLKLIAGENTVHINPTFIKYFQDAYKQVGGINKMVVADIHQPVKIYGVDDSLIGLIMPVRV